MCLTKIYNIRVIPSSYILNSICCGLYYAIDFDYGCTIGFGRGLKVNKCFKINVTNRYNFDR